MKSNPFKMWGSYVGAGVGLIYSFTESGFLLARNLLSNIPIQPVVIYFPFFIVAGFLVGYGIHSLINKVMK